jgi:hypothetical protein
VKFEEIINRQLSLLNEADDAEAQQPADAAAPDPNTAAPTAPEVAQVAPAGYVDIVRLLAKAMSMNFPPGALDELFQTPIVAENAFSVREAIKSAISSFETYNGNDLRQDDDPHYKKFVGSINPSTYQNVLKKIEAVVDPKRDRDKEFGEPGK